MKGLFEAIARFFSSLFGSKPDPQPPVTTGSTSGNTSSSTGSSGSSSSSTPSDSSSSAGSSSTSSGSTSSGSSSLGDEMAIELTRTSTGNKDILGKLSIDGKFICHTLENSESNCHIPSGSYSVSLRKKGGLHATYGYRFGSLHEGILWIENASGVDFAFIRMGNMASDTEGGIVLGEEVKDESNTQSTREVWNSEKAYRLLYPLVVSHLKTGSAAKIVVS